MKKWMKPIGTAVVVAGLTFAYAETPSTPAPPSPHDGHRSANRQEWMQQRFDRMSAYLNLTDAQKTQAQAILKESHESAKQFAPQLKQNRQALAEAVKANKTADIERLAGVQGRLMGKMMAIRGEAFARIYQTLTPEQRAKADQMHARWHGRRNG
jgi:Spy/CpxP family protein refolding chaperone